ncbi:MAG: hypothetical protein OEM78_10060 [Gammaproteobacteria bacterium]|nr:hypothetical protein [Gammaproteobacteria bacterium]
MAGEEAAWLKLQDLGVKVVPYLREAYSAFSRWQGRASLVFHSIRYARVSEDAFQLGLEALNDRATVVRYRACALVAYSLRTDELFALKKLLTHTDPKTVEDAKAAMNAVRKQNHHFFQDRDESGKVHWLVNAEDRASA